jgi:hypothetical protein
MIEDYQLDLYRKILCQKPYKIIDTVSTRHELFHDDNSIMEFFNREDEPNWTLIRLYDQEHNLEDEDLLNVEIARNIWRKAKKGIQGGKYSSSRLTPWKTQQEMFPAKKKPDPIRFDPLFEFAGPHPLVNQSYTRQQIGMTTAGIERGKHDFTFKPELHKLLNL